MSLTRSRHSYNVGAIDRNNAGPRAIICCIAAENDCHYVSRRSNGCRATITEIPADECCSGAIAIVNFNVVVVAIVRYCRQIQHELSIGICSPEHLASKHVGRISTTNRSIVVAAEFHIGKLIQAEVGLQGS